jgi:hypothetical protein
MGRDKDKETVSFENVKCLQATDSAIRVKFADREDPMWIPQSQVADDSEVYGKGHEGRLILTLWICQQRDLV